MSDEDGWDYIQSLHEENQALHEENILEIERNTRGMTWVLCIVAVAVVAQIWIFIDWMLR